MDLVDSIDEMFQWQTPFYCIDNPEVVDIPSLDGMLVDMELPEISNLVPEQAAAAASQAKPASPSHSIRTVSPVAPESSIRNVNNLALTVNAEISSLQIGARGYELVPAPTSPLSSAPNTPPVVKPKRSAKSKSSTNPKTAKKAKDVESLRLDAAAKEDRAPTKAEHIIRERQRRDDMAAKYSILESLLPPVPKRERAMVVEDAISFVGALQRTKVQLVKRLADLKQMAESPGWGKKIRSLEPGSGTVVNHPPGCITPSKQQNCKSDSPLSASPDGGVQVDPVIVTSTGPRTSTSAMNAINVHLGVEEIVMEIVWSQPRSNFQSALLQAVELLGFDVKKCSILRVGNGYMQCVITCTKSQVLTQRTSEIQSSSAMIIKALRNVLAQS